MLRFGLACALLTLAPPAAWAEAGGVALSDSVPSITVEGEARREVAPDLATVTLGVNTDRPTAGQASADNAAAAAAVVSAARAAGLGDADIRTTTLSLYALANPRDASKTRAYRASNQVALKVRDLGRLGALVGRFTAEDANTVEGVAFAIDDPRPILDGLRADATRDAARRAEIYAKAAGVKLGRVLRIVPNNAGGPVPVQRAYKLDMAVPAPAPPVEAGTEALEARVQVTWELVP